MFSGVAELQNHFFDHFGVHFGCKTVPRTPQKRLPNPSQQHLETLPILKLPRRRKRVAFDLFGFRATGGPKAQTRAGCAEAKGVLSILMVPNFSFLVIF